MLRWAVDLEEEKVENLEGDAVLGEVVEDEGWGLL